jgi:hypothetical protein
MCVKRSEESSVVDPYSFFPDPDPDPECDDGDQYGSGFRIRIQILLFSSVIFKMATKKCLLITF